MPYFLVKTIVFNLLFFMYFKFVKNKSVSYDLFFQKKIGHMTHFFDSNLIDQKGDLVEVKIYFLYLIVLLGKISGVRLLFAFK